jgi:hypothetical protein
MVKIVLHEHRVYSFDRDQISLGFTVICMSVEFVLSIVIKLFKFKFAFYVKRAFHRLACSGGHKILNLNLLGDCSLHMYKLHISLMRDQAGQAGQ